MNLELFVVVIGFNYYEYVLIYDVNVVVDRKIIMEWIYLCFFGEMFI